MLRRPNFVAFAALLFVACGPTGPEATWEEPDWAVDDSDAGEEPVGDVWEGPPEPVWDTSGGGPLTGYFAVEAVVNVEVVILSFQTRQIFLLRMLQDGTTIRQRLALCDLRFPSVEGLAELIIPKTVQALFQTKVQTTQGEFVSGEEVGAIYAPDPLVNTAGVVFAGEPLTDYLPTMDSPVCPEGIEPAYLEREASVADETCIFDEDHDDNPGVTIAADVALCAENPQALYIALRASFDLEGVVGEDHASIEGSVEPKLDWTVLGWSDECLEAAAGIKAKILPDSTFKAVRVDGGPYNLDSDGDGVVRCHDVLGAWDGLLSEPFPPPPPREE